MSKQTYHFPLIVIERPHQRPGCAWAANSAEDITDQLSGNAYGENWSRERIESLSAVEECWGTDREDWPEELREATEGDFPAIYTCSPFGNDFAKSGGEEADAAAELAFAIEYIGHDFNGIDLPESREEAEAVLASKRHNTPYRQLRDAMQSLGWLDQDDEEE